MAISAADVKKNAFILSSLVGRDFKLKYRRSVLGVLWSVLNPLLTMLVMTFVFSYLFRFGIKKYALYLILGQVLFNFMVAATNGGLYSIISSAALIKKIRIEKVLFPLEKVISELVNFALSLIAIPAVMIYYHAMPTWRVALLPLLLVYVLLFYIGMSLVLAALAVFFRDIAHLWGVFTLMWMYATPIFYPVHDTLPPQFEPLMNYNPMYRYITYFRDIVMNNVTPSLHENLVCLGIGLVMFAIGLAIFRATEKRFILYV